MVNGHADSGSPYSPNGLKRPDDISLKKRNHAPKHNRKSGTQISTMRMKNPHIHDFLDLETVASRVSNIPPHIIITTTRANTIIIF